MSEKHQPGSPASDKIADLETLEIQAVTEASRINGNISPASPVVANDEDDEKTIKRTIIRRNARNDEVPSNDNSWPDQHIGNKTQESSDASEQETPFVEQLEFPSRKQPFQVEVSLFDTLNLPTASAEVSLVDTLTLPTHPTTTPLAGSLPATPNEIELAALAHGNIPRDASHEHFEIPQHLNHAMQNKLRSPLVHTLAYPLKLPLLLWRFSPILSVLALLVPLLGAGSLEYNQLNQMRDSMYQVDLLTGSTQWQHTITSPMQIASIDSQGSLLITSTGAQQRQLEAFNHDGVLEWHTAASKETFSLPAAASPPGTVLVALSSISATSPATSGSSAAIYLRSLSFYLLRRSTGQTIWQKTLVEGQQQQQAVILGFDTQFIYVALIEAAFPSPNTATGTKLLALNQATGQLAWQVLAPTPSGMHLQDGGKLLVEQHHITWQVAGSVYA
ncbi:MAG TPA: PQQ-binding-like beta-propeller repeat protein, partial [Ktedonobacteraceae bacterium]|nr:PQQ-binding-like beta-propeller repeat protein [Ktedonobacteraceae bacterium]